MKLKQIFAFSPPPLPSDWVTVEAEKSLSAEISNTDHSHRNLRAKAQGQLQLNHYQRDLHLASPLSLMFKPSRGISNLLKGFRNKEKYRAEL